MSSFPILLVLASLMTGALVPLQSTCSTGAACAPDYTIDWYCVDSEVAEPPLSVTITGTESPGSCSCPASTCQLASGCIVARTYTLTPPPGGSAAWESTSNCMAGTTDRHASLTSCGSWTGWQGAVWNSNTTCTGDWDCAISVSVICPQHSCWALSCQ